MAAVTTAHQKQIEQAISADKPEAAFAILEGYADLRHADMPPLSKAALNAIGKNPEAVRRFVIGTTALSLSVRRFCRKYLPKVGAPASGPLLALAADGLDPFRPGDGLLGSFGGVASPIARTILDQELGFEVKANQAYSEASRYCKEVMDDVIFLVGATSHENLARLCEYQWGVGRVAGLVTGEVRNWPHADFFPPWAHQAVGETLAKNVERWGETLVRWTSGRTLLLDEPSSDPVVRELARRVREGGDEALAKLRENLLLQFTRNFHGLSQEHRQALYRNLCGVRDTVGPRLKPYFDRTLQDYRQRFPGEAEDAAREATAPASGVTAPGVTAPGVAAPGAGAPVESSPVPASSAHTTSDDGAGPGGERAQLAAKWLAFAARLPKLHAEINRALEEDLRDDEGPEPGGSAEDEAIVGDLHQAILRHRATRPGVDTTTRPRWGEDRTYVPEGVLENAAFADGLTALLIRMITPERAFKLAAVAATCLSRGGLHRFGEAWAERAGTQKEFYQDWAFAILDPLAERRLAPVALLRSLFGLQGLEFPIELTEGWQRAIAMLYLRGGAPGAPAAGGSAGPAGSGRAAVLELLARHPYPKDVNEYCNRRDFHDSHLGTMWAAWERRDADVLAVAFERFAIPYFWKGSKALLPKREPFFLRSGFAARSDTGEGVPLADAWKLAASAGRTAATTRAALQHAELSEAPRTLLELASPGDFDGLGDDVLALLESSNPAVLSTGLTILGRVPAVVAERAGEAVTLAASALTSTRSGAAKEAAVALAAIGNAHPTVRPQAYAALADGLALEAAPVLQAILKCMKSLPGKLPGDARQRILELSQSDPGKFEKLAKPLLAA